MRHATAKGVEVEAEPDRILQQHSRGVIEREMAARRLFEESLAYQMPQDPGQRVGIGARGGGKLVDLRVPRRNVIGDP